MKFQSINDCFEYLRDGYSFSESLLDAINAYREGVDSLEQLFDKELWLAPDHEFENDTDKQYYIGLSRIEEILVANSLIYNQ